MGYDTSRLVWEFRIKHESEYGTARLWAADVESLDATTTAAAIPHDANYAQR